MDSPDKSKTQSIVVTVLSISTALRGPAIYIHNIAVHVVAQAKQSRRRPLVLPRRKCADSLTGAHILRGVPVIDPLRLTFCSESSMCCSHPRPDPDQRVVSCFPQTACLHDCMPLPKQCCPAWIPWQRQWRAYAKQGSSSAKSRRFSQHRWVIRACVVCRLCMQHGDRVLADWSAAEANNELEDDTEYEVIAILDERKRKGKREFLVKWRVWLQSQLNFIQDVWRHQCMHLCDGCVTKGFSILSSRVLFLPQINFS